MTRKNEAGQALIAAVTALGILLMGFAGLGIDIGYLRYEKRLQQTAADGAAIAGAAEIPYGSSGVTTAAQKAASINGFTDSTGTSGCPSAVGCVTVTVNTPPSSGPHSGSAGYVEVYVAQVQPTFFMRILAINKETVTARAVAYLGNGSSCGYALDPTATDAFKAVDNSNVTINCGVIVDSNASTAVDITGNGNFSAPSIGAVGGANDNGNSHFNASVQTGIAPAADPLAYVPAPTAGACTPANTGVSFSYKSSVVVPSGTYCNGLTVSGNSYATFSGTYVIVGGGLNITGNSNVTASDVTFYDTYNSTYAYGPVNVSGNGNATFSAPTSGSLDGMLFFQDRSVPASTSASEASTVTGGSNVTFNGAIYFPTTSLTFGGDSNATGAVAVVAYTLTIGGVSNTSIGNNLPAGQSPIKDAVLVE